MSGPEAPERRQPGVQFFQRRRGEAVQSALGIHLRLHEAGVTQYPEVLRDRRLRHAELTLDLTDRLLGGRQQAQDRAPVWLRDDLEYRIHALNIPTGEYACQGILKAARKA